MLINAIPALAQIAEVPSETMLSKVKTAKAYSPYAVRNYPQRPLWGDTHLHTNLSTDAGLAGNRLSPVEAYRFARGEEIVTSFGHPARLSRPLDWLVIADHSDGMGMFGALFSADPDVMVFEQAARWNKGMLEGGEAAVKAKMDLIRTFSAGEVEPELSAMYSPGAKIYKNLWEKVVADAEAFNHPG